MQPPSLGDVVAHARLRGVLWQVAPGLRALLPIIDDPGEAKSGDVPLENIGDLCAAGVVGRRLVIRVAAMRAAPDSGLCRIGRLTGALQCSVSRAVIVVRSSAAVAGVWHRERERRAERLDAERCVRM